MPDQLLSRILTLAALILLPFAAAAQEALPAERFVYWPDTDFPGNDLSPLFDTTAEACARACRANPDCRAFTFNSDPRACFLKGASGTPTPFAGAISARRVPTDPALRQSAEARRAALPAMTDADVERARELVADVARRFPAGGQTAAGLGRALSSAVAEGRLDNARLWAGFLASAEDSAAAWTAFAAASLRLPESVAAEERNRARVEALPAALNGVLRARGDAAEAAALAELAVALEMNGRGRDMIGVLRRAQALSGRADLAARLEDAIGKYGFRIVDHQIDSDAASPRICATFSEPLVDRGLDYDTYVRVPGHDPVTEAKDQQLCIDGVAHGERYEVTFREGLPAESGEALARSVTLNLYVRDRGPQVSFPGRAYILPRQGGAGVPVETVNAGTLDLRLRAVSDRNLLRAIDEGWFAQPLTDWEERRFGEAVAQDVWTGTADVAGELNREVLTRLPVDEMLAGRDPGIYALSARSHDAPDAAWATQWFVLSDLGLSTQNGSDGLHVAVRGLSDAGPRAGVRLRLISRANAVLGEVQTGADGFATFPAGLARGTGQAAPALVLAETEGDMAFLPLTGPAFDLSDRGVEGRPAPGPVDAFLATDRGAYRVGEVIGVTALLRDAALDGVSDLPVTAVLRRPDGAEYSRAPAASAEAGGYVFTLPLGGDVPRGTWRLDLVLTEDAEPLASETLIVEDFLPERLDFTLDVPGEALSLDDRPPLIVQADYLFGAPAADLGVEAELQLKAVRTLAEWEGYLFSPHDAPLPARSRFLAPARTDATGRAVMEIAFPEIDAQNLPLQATLIVRVSEGSGRPVERSRELPMSPAAPLIGIRPGFDDVVPEGGEAAFDVIGVGPDGALQEGEARWTLNRLETRYQWYELYGRWNWEPITRRSRVASGTLSLGPDPAELALPVEWGRYELIVERGEGGAPDYAVSSVTFDAGWYGAGEGADTPDRLPVSLDRESYVPGDTARLRIEASGGGTALVSVMAGAVLHREAVALEPGETVVPLDVTEDWGTGAYVAVMALRPPGGDDPAPVRALGIAYAGIAPGDRALAVEIEAPDVVDGQEGTVDVTVRIAGAPAPAFVTLAAVDLGIHNLTANDPPDPAGHYFGQKRLGVELRDVYGRLIDGLAGTPGEVRSGGDGGETARLQAPPPTEAPMVYFSGLVPVGPDGTATITVPKPAFNGTIRLDAIAWTAAAVGQASDEIVARDPVVLTASLPRFLAPGDRSRLLLEFVHADGPGGALPLSIATPGLDTGDVPATVEVAAGGRATLEIPVTAGAPGDYPLRVAVELPNGAQLVKDLTLGVRRNDPEVAVTRRFTLAPGETFRFDSEVFAGLVPGVGGATLSAGPLARFDLPGLLRQLDRYPYGCTEQLTSTALPLLSLSDFAPETVDVAERVRGALSRILTRQSGAGSFGLWQAGGGDLWLDAYVTDFLTRAADAGYDVPERALTLALDNLQNRVNYAPDFDTGGEDLAYALWVLAGQGRAAMADLRYYADAKRTAFATPRAAAQVGAALASYGDSLRADAMFAQASAQLALAETTPREFRADFGTEVSDAAAVLRLASIAGSDSVDAAALAARLTPDRPLSTQEAAQVLLAIDALRGAPNATGIEVDGAPVAGPVIRSLDNPATGDGHLIRNAGDRPTDLTLTTFGVPEVAPAANGYGYSLSRAYYTTDGEPAAAPIAAGAQLLVVLTIQPFEEVGARLMLEDPLPAGLEIDNPNLIAAGQLPALDWLEPAPVDHAEFLSDRFRAALTVRGTEPVQLAYKVRAVSPGDYHHPAAMVHDMYRPEYRAITDTGRWQVTE